ncbi:hypothetical protein [Gaiella sp.]|uniref:hypothetical protein n=1 Tax=Gaiella sp. TaxID=2663207 RepID=UPI002E360638|nr:hypothetical protein [Gaiella sp.]HEX5584976.1 hypothetical protein [Gaiella sp.]
MDVLASATRVDKVEWAASTLRTRIADALAVTGPVDRGPWAQLPLPRRRIEGDGEALVARASDRALRRVHAAAREAHVEWRDGGDVAEAMHRLGSALSVAAEFDAS